MRKTSKRRQDVFKIGCGRVKPLREKRENVKEKNVKENDKRFDEIKTVGVE
jgi:hypothetical protein